MQERPSHHQVRAAVHFIRATRPRAIPCHSVPSRAIHGERDIAAQPVVSSSFSSVPRDTKLISSGAEGLVTARVLWAHTRTERPRRLQHRHDVCPRPGPDTGQQDEQRDQDEQERRLLPPARHLCDVVLWRELGSALADEHVQRPRKAEGRPNDAEGQAEVHTQAGGAQGPAPKAHLRDAPAVNLTHRQAVERLCNQATPDGPQRGWKGGKEDRIGCFLGIYARGWRGSRGKEGTENAMSSN